MNGIFANYLWTTVLGKRILNILNYVNFSRENTNIDVSVFMVDLRVIHMSSECEYDWYWKNISLLDRIWSLWLVRFAHSLTNFIFWLGRLIFSVSINSHPYTYITEKGHKDKWWSAKHRQLKMEQRESLYNLGELRNSNTYGKDQMIYCFRLPRWYLQKDFALWIYAFKKHQFFIW